MTLNVPVKLTKKSRAIETYAPLPSSQEGKGEERERVIETYDPGLSLSSSPKAE